MTNPIGLTRAEEALQEKQPEVRIVVRAAPGAVKCRMSVPPNGADCGAAATCRIVWPCRADEAPDKTPACADCALRTQQMAEAHRTNIRIEPGAGT